LPNFQVSLCLFNFYDFFCKLDCLS
jgi:hypothetical protein